MDMHRVSVKTLHIVLGVGLLYLSVLTAVHGFTAHEHREQLHLSIVGSLEAVAAILFLIPQTLRIGAAVLVLVVLGAALVHGLNGQLRVDLLVYAAAVWVVMAHGPKKN